MEFWRGIKFIWGYARDQKLKLFLFILGNLFSVAISILVPILGAKQIIHITNNELSSLLVATAIIFGVEMSRNFGSYMTRKCAQVIYRETFSLLQVDLCRNILKMENEALDKTGSGVFIQRLSNDAAKLSDIFGSLNFYFANILTNIGVFGAVFIINRWIFLYMLIMVIILYVVEAVKFNEIKKKDKAFREKNEKITGLLGEIVRGARDIKMLNAEKSFIGELEGKICDVNEFRYGMQKTERIGNLASSSIRDLFDFLLMALMALMIYKGHLTIASALIVYNYSGRVPLIVNYISNLLDRARDFNLSFERVSAILDDEEFKKENFGSVHLDKVEGNFEFKNVKFKYDNNLVLKGVSFKIKANETVAFVGKSGAGKTTLFNLLCKMYDVQSGKITIDGVDVNKLDRESIRGNITIISQNPYIFNMSIRDNLRLVKDNLTDEEMVEACRMAALEDFIEELPLKYDTVIGEGGVTLSGGQKQRLAIARAFVQKTEIILFDEATSALDNETQTKIQEAIDNMKNEYTILIIAHRLSTIVNADRIIFLNDGKIEMEGTHKELLMKCPDYKHLYESEIKK